MAESQNSNTPANGDMPVLYLEIQSGHTRFPRRPVRPGRFVIGSHPTCQLQLGGEEMPLIHTLLVADEAGVVVERIAAQPPLLVNGLDIESDEIQDGDLIQIGSICFIVRFDEDFQPITLSTPMAREERLADASLFDDADEPAEVSDLSAAQLVDLITADMELIEDFETTQSRGLAAMAEAALELDNADYDESLFGKNLADFDADDPDSVYQHLAHISEELNARAEMLRDSTRMETEMAERLLEQQALLSQQLDTLVNRLARHTIPMKRSA